MNKFSVLLRKGYWCQGNLTFHIDIYVIVHCNEVFKIYSQNIEHTMFIFVKFRCDDNVFVYFKRESFCLRQLIYIYIFFLKKKLRKPYSFNIFCCTIKQPHIFSIAGGLYHCYRLALSHCNR